ncbi:D-xylulose 5-phosphate/D-fructose 6-phosphate phosphoketolase [Serendipita vermifera]|nr:D-xylulose 5-phosphate/D-fructose 6-phosphate phosphoketolase [Serendipita vermifera]
MLPNPPPDPSQLPESVLDVRVKLQNVKNSLSDEELHAVECYKRVANYMAAAMIYLRKNTLLESPLSKEDIKPRLLGHWGTCPGLNLIYAHLNLLIKKNDLDMFLIVGPGHGAPAVLASLWLEDSLCPYYPDLTRTKEGFAKLIAGFSTPTGFPSHVSADVPGSIHEGGELGYALSVAFGAIMDKPELIVACVVGDGEAETGPTATAWHGYKYIDPAESGAVLPILHCNGFKISERTIFGTMDDREITALFTGYGYQVCIVEDLPNLDNELAAAMSWALGEIRSIQKAARSGKPIVKPRWPVIILRTPKGMSGPKALAGVPIEGSYKSHQVPLSSPTKEEEQFKLLKAWLESYEPDTILSPETKLLEKIDKYVIPSDPQKRMGQRKETNIEYHPIDVPDWIPLTQEKGCEFSSTKLLAKYLAEVFKKNPTTTRLWSPDELESNKLDGVFEVTTRDFQWDPETRAKGGRVVEILSEHTCQGMMQGYILTGRTGIFPSYESFLGIIHTMMVQYAKFIKMAREKEWRKDVACFNYLETSTWARQEHNGFSHQNPSFIGAVLNLKAKYARVYLPPDANCMVSTMAHCFGAKNYINLVIGSKHETPVWLSAQEAAEHCKNGASVWKFASTHNGENPDVVLVGIGTEVNFEVITAVAMLREMVPELRVRMVNVTDLMVLGAPNSHPHALNNERFNEIFTPDRHIHFSYHGYPIELAGLLFGRPNLERVSMEGYREEGTTTTPLAMMVLNQVSRYDVAKVAIGAARKVNDKVDAVADKLIQQIDKQLDDFWKYIKETGKDPDGSFDKPKLA